MKKTLSLNHEIAEQLYQRLYKNSILLFVFLASSSQKYTYNYLNLLLCALNMNKLVDTCA